MSEVQGRGLPPGAVEYRPYRVREAEFRPKEHGPGLARNFGQRVLAFLTAPLAGGLYTAGSSVRPTVEGGVLDPRTATARELEQLRRYYGVAEAGFTETKWN